jgi:hypothetical protein
MLPVLGSLGALVISQRWCLLFYKGIYLTPLSIRIQKRKTGFKLTVDDIKV